MVALCIADEKLTVHTQCSPEDGKSAIVFVEEPGKSEQSEPEECFNYRLKSHPPATAEKLECANKKAPRRIKGCESAWGTEEEERRKSNHKDNLLSLHCKEYFAVCICAFVKAVVGKKEWVCSLGDSGMVYWEIVPLNQWFLRVKEMSFE